MPSLIKRRGAKRWRGQVVVAGTCKQRWFPDASKESQRQASAWELATKKEMQSGIDTGYLRVIDWINEYLADAETRLSKKTHKEKVSAFRNFAAFAGVDENTPIDSITKDVCRRYLIEQNKRRSGYAANKDRKNLATAWSWGRDNIQGWPIGNNSFSAVPKFKEKRQPRYVPPEDDFWKIYDIIEHQQDRCMLLAFLHLAARRNEIFNLKRQDIDFGNQRIRLWTNKRSGGREYNWLPMTDQVTESLREWIKQRMQIATIDDDHVFVCLDKSPFTDQYYGKPFLKRQHWMKKLCKRAGVKPFGFHAIRHLSASILYKAGVPVAHIQAVLRHKNMTTTNRYLQSLGVEDVRAGLNDVFSNVVNIRSKTKRVPQESSSSIKFGNGCLNH